MSVVLMLSVIPHCHLSLQDPPIKLASGDEEEYTKSAHQATELHPVIRLYKIFLVIGNVYSMYLMLGWQY